MVSNYSKDLQPERGFINQEFCSNMKQTEPHEHTHMGSTISLKTALSFRTVEDRVGSQHLSGSHLVSQF